MDNIDKAKANQIVAINLEIKNLRKKLGLNQVEFAKRAGIGLRFLRELEQGKISVRLDKLFQVVNFLGYHLELKRNDYKETT
jgi:y4mF family transcriptional regulator